MGADTASAEALFEGLVTHFSTDPSVTPPSVDKGGRFGASGLKVDGRLFAMVSRGELVLKLHRTRVEELVASGIGRPFDPGHGRVMKEWITISPCRGQRWRELAQEALQFVANAERPATPRST